MSVGPCEATKKNETTWGVSTNARGRKPTKKNVTNNKKEKKQTREEMSGGEGESDPKPCNQVEKIKQGKNGIKHEKKKGGRFPSTWSGQGIQGAKQKTPSLPRGGS